MNFRQGNYLIGEAFGTLRRHKGVMLLSIMIMSLTLLVLAVFLMATDNMLVMLDRTKQDLKVYVYLSDAITTSQTHAHQVRLLSMPEVESILYISKSEALDEFRQELGDDALVLETLETNPLPASFRVNLKSEHRDKASTEAFAANVAKLDNVEEVNYGKDFLERFTMLTRVFFYVDVVLGIIVILSAIFIISNTVRLTILGRLKSIEVLKLVGATNRFIRTPFIIEGAVQGGLASVVSLALLYVIYLVVRGMLPDLAFLAPEKIVLYIVACVLIGALGSYTSLQRVLSLR